MTATLSSIGTNESLRAEVAVPIVSVESHTLVALMFAVKTFAAALLALFISFWLALDEPYWALLTVFVVSQPDSGLVLAKSFYRILGTTAGLLVTVALVFALAQYGELFITLLADGSQKLFGFVAMELARGDASMCTFFDGKEQKRSRCSKLLQEARRIFRQNIAD